MEVEMCKKGIILAIFYTVSVSWLAAPVMSQTTPAFSDEIILYRGERFMPFIDGPIEENSFSSPDFTRQQLRMVGAMRENLVKASAVMKACELFHPPQGFKLSVQSNTLPPVEFHNNESLSGSLRLELFVTMVCNERPCYDKKTDASVTLIFNDPTQLAAIHVMDDIWLQPRKISDFYGHPVYTLYSGSREITVVSNSEVPLYVPVMREDFIMTLIGHFAAIISEDEQLASLPKAKDKLLSLSEEERAERNSEFDKAYASMFRFDPLLARKLKDNFEEAERRLSEAQSDTSLSITQAQFVNMQVNVWREAVRKLRAELNAMSPSERRSQAHWSESEQMNTSGLTPPGYPGSHPVARINPLVIDNSRPITDIQLITIEWGVDIAPYATFKQGRSLQYNKLFELSQCEDVWKQILELVNDISE
jgi:flagellar biosynthesis chaperone FliJ